MLKANDRHLGARSVANDMMNRFELVVTHLYDNRFGKMLKQKMRLPIAKSDDFAIQIE